VPISASAATIRTRRAHNFALLTSTDNSGILPEWKSEGTMVSKGKSGGGGGTSKRVAHLAGKGTAGGKLTPKEQRSVDASALSETKRKPPK
jgi:hypothetical protein